MTGREGQEGEDVDGQMSLENKECLNFNVKKDVTLFFLPQKVPMMKSD